MFLRLRPFLAGRMDFVWQYATNMLQIIIFLFIWWSCIEGSRSHFGSHHRRLPIFGAVISTFSSSKLLISQIILWTCRLCWNMHGHGSCAYSSRPCHAKNQRHILGSMIYIYIWGQMGQGRSLNFHGNRTWVLLVKRWISSHFLGKEIGQIFIILRLDPENLAAIPLFTRNVKNHPFFCVENRRYVWKLTYWMKFITSQLVLFQCPRFLCAKSIPNPGRCLPNEVGRPGGRGIQRRRCVDAHGTLGDGDFSCFFKTWGMQRVKHPQNFG